MTPTQIVVIVCALLAAGLFVAGVYVLSGAGWALIAASFVLAMLVVILLKGMRNEIPPEVAG